MVQPTHHQSNNIGLRVRCTRQVDGCLCKEGNVRNLVTCAALDDQKQRRRFDSVDMVVHASPLTESNTSLTPQQQ